MFPLLLPVSKMYFLLHAYIFFASIKTTTLLESQKDILYISIFLVECLVEINYLISMQLNDPQA